jgi:hypothetical protein
MSLITFSMPPFGAAIAGQGGYFSAIMRGPIVSNVQQAPYALLVSDTALGEIAASPWGEYGKDVPGARSRINGQTNTDAMVAAGCQAALQVRAITIEGHSDYFLASIGELNAAAANTPELFDPDGIYWASTQVSRDDAFVQDFESGSSDWDLKGGDYRVRAFRAIPLELLNP